jgi:hypothetical protein
VGVRRSVNMGKSVTAAGYREAVRESSLGVYDTVEDTRVDRALGCEKRDRVAYSTTRVCVSICGVCAG